MKIISITLEYQFVSHGMKSLKTVIYIRFSKKIFGFLKKKIKLNPTRRESTDPEESLEPLLRTTTYTFIPSCHIQFAV